MRIGVIGGGAAGFFGGINAALTNESARVDILEATQQPLDKVRISGGGRCNVTHHCFDAAELVRSYPRGHKELRGPFSRFQPSNTVKFFEERGVRLKFESDGRMFPVSDSSSTIIDCLMRTAREAGVTLKLNARVRQISTASDGKSFELSLHDREPMQFDRILIATGSAHQGYRFAESLGHTIVPCVPSLFTFKVKDPRIEELSGVSFSNVALELRTDDGSRLNQSGPMLITHWGLSGPAVLKLSAWGARLLHHCRYHALLKVDFLPTSTEEDIRNKLSEARDRHPKRHPHTEALFGLPNRYWQRIVDAAGISADTTWANVSKNCMTALMAQLRSAEFEISGKGIFKEEFVTCGGVDLKEIDFKTMQSRIRPGCYFAGEILDIDGITGGFNFQAAWTTGWIAGSSMAE